MGSMHALGYEPGLVEPFAVQDTLISGLSHIEMLGSGIIRFVCFSTIVAYDTGLPQHRVSARLVAPLTCVPDALTKTIRCLGSGIVYSAFH